MKQMIRAAAMAITFAFGLAGTAQAKDMEYYGGVGVGGFNVKSTITGLGSQSGMATGVFAYLGSDINDYIGAELRFGGTTGAPVWGLHYKLNYFLSYLAKPQVPLGESVSLYALVGGTTANLKTNGGLNTTKTSFTFGGGAKLRVDENWSVAAEWVRYLNNAKVVNGLAKINVDGISFTADLRF